jgi:hypothetical protein
MPGALMAMLRLNRPSILVYGGTIAAGCYKNKELDVVSAFEAWGEKVAGVIDEKEYKIEKIYSEKKSLKAPIFPTTPGKHLVTIKNGNQKIYEKQLFIDNRETRIIILE